MSEDKKNRKHDGLILSGIKVIDFSRLLPGPFCSQMLADFGADVIKVEQPEIGDYSRFNPPNYTDSSVYFNSVNSNKRSIALDLTKPDGRGIAHKLIADADVILESFRSGVAEKLGVDYASTKAINPSIIYCAITGYGQSGPLARVPGHDLVIQSMTGLMGMTLDREPLPPVPGFQAADYAAGAMAPTAILAALMKRQQSGNGTYIDLSMYDCLFYMCNIVQTGAMARLHGQTGQPMMETWGGNPRYRTYLTKDGKPVAVSLLEAKVWAEFCNTIERPDLIDETERPEDRHSNHGDRAAIYEAAISEYCAARNRDELLAKMEAHQMPICAVYTPDEAIASENVAARGLVERISHPTEGEIPHLSNPLGHSGLTRADRNPAPGLGADGAEILAEMGYSESDVQRLTKEGVIA